MTKECRELKNIEYQNMLLNHTVKKEKKEDNISNIDNFLQQEKMSQKKKTWSKLEKALKITKLSEYVNTYSKKNNLSKNKQIELKQYLFTCLNRKKLQRVKDVIYDINTGKIKNIPGLSFNKNKFTLKRIDKKGTTLKCLAPKRKTKKK